MPHLYDTPEFELRYTYHGTDLGAVWTPAKTTFRLWAPTASNVQVNLYRSGTPGADDLLARIAMHPGDNGTWVAEKAGDMNGIYYTFLIEVDGYCAEACDPYARTTGVNGERAMVIDLKSTNPEGWEQDCDPHAGMAFTDAVIYEAHIRDLTMDDNSGAQHKGKYSGVAEPGTHTPEGIPTGLDHMKALGITHLHILPMYDYGFTDETLPLPQYNWGYDPVNFNVPEGSYSTDPYHGEVRVREVKQMVKDLHSAGISVVMDVVYNHVYDAGSFCFNKVVPMYFSRFREDGSLLNDSCCGNDTASERSMVRKYIVDSVKYWVEEYHIDGFRFDLVGLIDVVTMREVMDAVHADHPNVVFYGEGWDMYTGKNPKNLPMTIQKNGHLVPGFAFFNDTTRDILKGSVFDHTLPGFVSGNPTDKKLLFDCYRGAPHWAVSPAQSVNYVSCHDNHALLDRITLSTPGASRRERIRMHNLAAAFSLTAQGIPFFQAGEEMLRSKPLGRRKFDENSYRAPDSVNALKWGNLSKSEYMRNFHYYQGLIALRKASPLLRDTRGDSRLMLETGSSEAVAFLIGREMIAIFNAGKTPLECTLPEGNWNILVKGQRAGTTPFGTAIGSVSVEPISATILSRRKLTP